MPGYEYHCNCCHEDFISMNPKRQICPECVAEHSPCSKEQLEDFLQKALEKDAHAAALAGLQSEEEQTESPSLSALSDLFHRMSPHDLMIAGAWQWVRNRNNREKWYIGEEED